VTRQDRGFSLAPHPTFSRGVQTKTRFFAGFSRRNHTTKTQQKPASLNSPIVSVAGQVKARTLSLDLTGLKSYHVELGLDTSAVEDTRLEGVLEPWRYQKGTARRTTTRAYPSHSSETHSNPSSPIPTSIHKRCLCCGGRAALSLAFPGFLGIGEITYFLQDTLNPQFTDFPNCFITKRWVQIRGSNSLILTLPASKTDWLRK
jgi:hypothetical protein